MKRLQADFDRTFKALEEGLQVEHIAEFDLKTCHPEESAVDVLVDPSFDPYDQIPVRNSRGIVGVLERPRTGNPPDDARVDEIMVPLNSSMLAADSQPVASLLDALKPSHYRLVVKGGDIEGIMTASDLLKMPVRLYAFMLVTHLEMLMAASIRSKYRNQPMESWLSQLSPGRQRGVREKVDSYTRRRLDPDPIEFTGFCDKREILKEFHPASRRFVDDMMQIEALRNSLAHAGTYLSDNDDLEVFLSRVTKTRRNIDYLRRSLHEF